MYSEPEWSQATTKSGYVEVLKNGKTIETISIPPGTNFFSFGRLPDNSLTLDHESISRNHAVLQFGPRNTAFIFDLGSTHGTFLNKKRIPPNKYIKITSGNDIFHFGGSSRLFLINLEENESSSIEPSLKPDSGRNINFRESVLNFFISHGISLNQISYFQKENISSCHFDFSSYISIDSSEPSIITSSGATKLEAYENFYEDAFSFLSRLGFIEKNLSNEDISDSDESHFSDQEVENRIGKSENALSEAQVLALRDQYDIKIKKIQSEISSLQEKLNEMEGEIVEDFDVYIQNLKKAELVKDIEKRQDVLNDAKKEHLKYEKILKLIGFKEKIEVVADSKDNAVPQMTTTLLIEKQKEKSNELVNELKKSKQIKKACESDISDLPAHDEEDEFKNITEFEDSTIHEEKMDLNKLKRKYGY